MSNSQSHESPAQYPLHSVLEVALGSLDVQLEEELARYRRQRTHQHVAPTAQSAAIAPPPPEPTAPTPTGENNDVVNLTQAATTQPVHSTDDAPQDYLQSSEALLKNLEQSSTPTTPPPTTTPQSKLTWWHMGTALILGIVATLIGLSLQQAQVSQEPVSEASPTPASPEVSRSPATTSTPSASREPLDLDGPNLAESDRDVTDTPPAPPSPAPTSSPSPSPVLPGREPDLTSALLPTPSQASPTETDSDAEAGEADAPAPNPANVAAGPPANDRFYHVVVNYEGEQTLTQAQAIVEGVYLRKFPDGIKVQMGAFGSVEDAQSLVNRLKTQGISAKIYEPQ